MMTNLVSKKTLPQFDVASWFFAKLLNYTSNLDST